MPYLPYRRSCLSILFNEVPHLFVVMNDPTPSGDCLLVMISSDKPTRLHDPSCALEEGDHPYIDKPSHVVYRIAETVRAAHITKMVDLKAYEKRMDMDRVIFERVAKGLYDSDETRLRIIKFARAAGI